MTIAIDSIKKNNISLSPHQRATILKTTAQTLQEQTSWFVEMMTRESGNCLKDSLKEIKRAIDLLKISAEEAKRINGESINTQTTSSSTPGHAFTIWEPIGLVAAITPFNRPLNQVVVKLAPAIAANNAVILKPSEKTPLTGFAFARLLLECGLPPGNLAVVCGEPELVGSSIIKSAKVDMITFTGSRSVGESIANSSGMVKTVFELGDNGALIICDDADLDRAVKLCVSGAYSTAGQSCRGIKRIFVQETIADRFAAELARATSMLRVGDPLDPKTDIGCLIDQQAANQVAERVALAVRDGAKVLYGGNLDGAQHFPTVLDHVSRDSLLVKEETFGPIAPLIRYNDFRDAVQWVNDSIYGLQTGVLTQNLARALYAVNHLKVGAVNINYGPHFGSPSIPFGGVKKSGLGREGVKYAIREMTTLKTVILNMEDSM